MHQIKWRWHLDKFEFVAGHWTGVKLQAADALPRLRTDEKDSTFLNDATAVLTIRPAYEAKEAVENDEKRQVVNEDLKAPASGLLLCLGLQRRKLHSQNPYQPNSTPNCLTRRFLANWRQPSERQVLSISTNAMDLWFVSPPLMEQYRMGFQDRYWRAFYRRIITCR